MYQGNTVWKQSMTRKMDKEMTTYLTRKKRTEFLSRFGMNSI